MEFSTTTVHTDVIHAPTKSVYLYFPNSTHCDELEKSFILSYNDARKSDFLKVLLENDNCDENQDSFHIVIPDILTLNM